MRSADGLDAQRALAACLRDASAAPPAHVDARRVAVYRELVFNNVSSLLASSFPVIRRLEGDAGWAALVRDFLATHGSTTPIFTELAREFLRYLPSRDARGLGNPPWLAELAHYEWAELALQILEASPPPLIEGPLEHVALMLSPLAWPLAYEWPVTRIAPSFRPDAPEAQPTLVLLVRRASGGVEFSELSAGAFRLLQDIEERPGMEAGTYLASLATEAGALPDEAFMQAGLRMLEAFAAQRVLGRAERP